MRLLALRNGKLRPTKRRAVPDWAGHTSIFSWRWKSFKKLTRLTLSKRHRATSQKSTLSSLGFAGSRTIRGVALATFEIE
jgi:hypothetical protein